LARLRYAALRDSHFACGSMVLFDDVVSAFCAWKAQKAETI
jgi:hypothetical protein